MWGSKKQTGQQKTKQNKTKQKIHWGPNKNYYARMNKIEFRENKLYKLTDTVRQTYVELEQQHDIIFLIQLKNYTKSQKYFCEFV